MNQQEWQAGKASHTLFVGAWGEEECVHCLGIVLTWARRMMGRHWALMVQEMENG